MDILKTKIVTEDQFKAFYELASTTINECIEHNVEFPWDFRFLFECEVGCVVRIESDGYNRKYHPEEPDAVSYSGDGLFCGVRSYRGRIWVKKRWAELFERYYNHLRRLK